ncbi:glucuronate isomerase [Flavilitoribacter nigricans]|uniref:Uronate isomerase n=1 Tax=Flavilitoribacter nigricans (strain ATCC 23147 / DSM 23189 / NBRC 102662 / NCIMB 1420 / SS-2) TaxID=1122177 RepID=A0A2D0N5G4_FLAN2|nr:glucuronate isomerase [Flavilitoribacter nigricans]PHN03745.1 glucuronate isomerase [Flavilitoribacter nigricans DSM 23189 = NBRC 102662]
MPHQTQVDSQVDTFLNENFLLSNETARELYHNYAADLPIIDYHCHLPPDEIASDKQFSNITSVWLNGDHYKWRAMRTNGISEKFITGSASDEEKFQKWAETVPYTMRNPLYHWTHLELKRYFGVDELLDGNSAKAIYDHCSTLLNSPDYSVRSLLGMMKVEIVCTTDDPLDDLSEHAAIKEDNCPVMVIPAFRPDKAILIQADIFPDYIRKLSDLTNVDTESFAGLVAALAKRAEYFHNRGCRLADHGLEQIYAADYSEADLDAILKRRLSGEKLFDGEALLFQSAVLFELGRLYHSLGWTQQYHLGALRNNNRRMLAELGPDTGFDSIGDFSQARSLSRFLNNLDANDQLAKTILYNLNPRDNEVMATMIGNYNDGTVAGKMQFGSAWWFLDQLDGMEKQMNALSNMGLLSRFVGMLTDSRSFLSFPRHEYFRRLLCDMFGRDVENGLLPNDTAWIGKIISDISYYNAKNYFGFGEQS